MINSKCSGDSELKGLAFKFGEVKQRGGKSMETTDKKKMCFLVDDTQKKFGSNSFDTFFIFISLIISYWLKMKGFTISTWFLPIPICFVLAKAKLLCLSDSLVFCMLLKIARFIIYHYKLILIISILSVVLPLFKSKMVLIILILFVLLYVIAKYLNSQNNNVQMIRSGELSLLIDETTTSITSADETNNDNDS